MGTVGAERLPLWGGKAHARISAVVAVKMTTLQAAIKPCAMHKSTGNS